jgi:membrane fusion protein (multidrug efflux system)
MMRKILVAAVVVIETIGLSLVLAADHSLLPQSELQTMRTVAVLPGLERQEIRAQLMPVRYTTLSAEVPARISRMAVKESARFAKGDLLVMLDCSLQEAQLKKAQAEQFAAEQVLAANTQLDTMNSIGKLELELSRAALDKARAEVLSNRTILSKCSINAPFAGRIVEQRVREQQYVQAGEPLFEILDDSQLELEFIVPSRWLAWIKPADTFNVVIYETGKTYPASFTRIGARVDPVSQSVKVAAAINGDYPELMAGMSGIVHLSEALTTHNLQQVQ